MFNSWGGFNGWASDGGVVVIPKGSRVTYQALGSHLLSTGLYDSVQNNDIIVEWLVGEGADGQSFNELMFNYLGSLGFVGSYSDRWYAWVNSD